MNAERLSQIVTPWAATLTYRIRIYFFGSRLKGTSRPGSDLDLAIEFLDPFINSEVIWHDLESKWAKKLSSLTGLNARPQVLNENSEPVNTYVKECSVVIFESPPEPESHELHLASVPGFSGKSELSSGKAELEDESGMSSYPNGRRGGNRGQVS